MPFLDTLVTPKSDRSLATTLYRKPTHTNQYLQWDSHHAISNKYSVINLLLHRAKDICYREISFHIINLSKCAFFKRQIQYLGHLILGKGMYSMKEKVEKILDLASPRDVTETRHIIKLAFYYRNSLHTLVI